MLSTRVIMQSPCVESAFTITDSWMGILCSMTECYAAQCSKPGVCPSDLPRGDCTCGQEHNTEMSEIGETAVLHGKLAPNTNFREDMPNAGTNATLFVRIVFFY